MNSSCCCQEPFPDRHPSAWRSRQEATRNARVVRTAARKGEDTVVLFDIASWSSHARFANQEKGSAGIDRVRNASCPRTKDNDTRCNLHQVRNAPTQGTTNSQGHRPDRRYRMENIGLLDDQFRRERRTQTMHSKEDTPSARRHVQRFSGTLQRRNVTSPMTADPLTLLPDQPSSGPAKVLLQQIE